MLGLALLGPQASDSSEARRLYCAQCAKDCIGAPRELQQVSGHLGQPSEASGGSHLSLECKCRAMYNSSANSIQCQQLGSAEARTAQSGGRPLTLTRAVAGSKAGHSQPH